MLLLLCGCTARIDQELFPGETVLYQEAQQIRGFDPARVGDVASSLAISRIYECLLQYAYLERPYRVEPLLAEAMPEISGDGLVYTFRIRKGIYFQDDPCFRETGGKGRELTAGDFVYSIKRIADLKNASNGYWAFNDRIVGLDEFRTASGGDAPTDYDRDVEGLRALDRYTLQITLKNPYPQLLYILTMHYSAALPREAVEYYGGEFVNHPVGTGPYVLRSWKRNYRMEFVRNPKWRETGRVDRYPSVGEPGDDANGLLADAGRPLPLVDRIVDYLVTDSSTSWLMFLTGQTEMSGISRDNWNAVMTAERKLVPELAGRGLLLDVKPTLRIGYIGFNMEDPVVGRNKKLRQAISCAFNGEAWIRLNNGRITQPNGPIPDGLPEYEDKPLAFPFDLDRARALMAEAGYANGRDPRTGRRLQLTLDTAGADNLEIRQSVELFSDFMDKIGVVIVPSYSSGPTFFDRLDRRQVQLYMLSWLADYPDAENFLQLFYGPNSSPGPNHSNYVNPAFDALYERARTMHDSPERRALYRQMAAIVVEDCPWVFASQPMAFVLRQPWLHNYKRHDFPYGMEKYYRVDAAERARARTALRK